MSFNRITGVITSKKIGEGGFATIFAGTYKVKKVAIKEPLKKKKSYMSSINHEIEVIKKIADFKDKHPDQESYSSCVTTYYGFYPSYYGNNLVMEYADYGNLSDWILEKKNSFNERLPPFNWSFGYPILKNITYALSFLHNQLNFIHSDVKTENILLFKSENDQEVVKAKLCDFGLTIEKNTKKNRGSPIYCAPEILNETSYNSEKSDVYGLACIIWEMETQKQLYNEFVFKTLDDFKFYINSGNRAKIPSRNSKIEILIELGWLSEEQRPTIDLYEEAFETDINTISDKLQEEQRKTFKTDNDFFGADQNYTLFDEIEKGNVEVVKTLLENKKLKNVNEISIFGSPLHYAVINQRHEIVELLLKNEANVNLEMEPGVDALTLAIRDNDLDMIKLLLENDADPRNALSDAIQNRDIHRVELLLNYKVNVNLELESGMNAFDLAIKKNDLDMVNLLLKYGANKTTENKEPPEERNTVTGTAKLNLFIEQQRRQKTNTLSKELPQKRSELNLNP